LSADSHIDLSTLAQCAEGTLTEEEARTVRDHFAECRSCLAAYVDAVRYRAAWLADSQAFRLEDRDRSLVRMDLMDGRSTEEHRGRPSTFRKVALVASFATLLAVSIQILARPEAPTLGFRLDPATLEATAHASAGGLVLPGAEAHADGSRPERRSGAAPSSLELEAELRAAIDAYEGSRGPEAGARVVAAFLADGDIAAASDYAQEALRAHPNDVPLLVFAAAARTRANDLPEAERLLRRAIRRAPRDPVVALDLGLVLCRLGRRTESYAWLERAAASPVAPVAARARRELRNCGDASGDQ